MSFSRLFFSFLILLTAGCRSLVFKTAADDVILVDKKYVFENDTIRMEYDFWAAEGVMGFAIKNKLNIPIYIDWRKSAFLIEGQKFDYWSDSQTATSFGVSSSYLYSGYNGNKSNNLHTGVTIISKPERILFLPPGSLD